MSSGGVYAIWPNRTGECLYVGETGDLEVRWRQHRSKLRHHKHPAPGFSEWYDAQEPDREGSIRFSVLERTDDIQQRAKLEAIWFDRLLPRFFGRVPLLSQHHGEYHERHRLPDEQSRQNMSVAQLNRYGADPRTVYVGDKVVVGLSETVQHTTVPIEERVCVDCGQHFYAVASYARQQCQNCWERHPIRKKILQYEFERPDEERRGSLSDLTEEVLREEYLELGLSTCEIAKRYGTSDVTVINRANRWGIPLRSRNEAIGSTKAKHKKALVTQIDQELLQLLWDAGVSEKLSRQALHLGVKLYKEIVTDMGLTRPSIRSKGHYSPMSAQLESDLRSHGVSDGLIRDISTELDKFR